MRNLLNHMKFTKKQLEKLADQTRLLSWAQGAIITSASGFNLTISLATVSVIIINFVTLQILGLFFDKRSEK
ncbi:MAG: hypothetical protein QG673_1762 [Pseudomonadota bacterium]|nr:hypothetical protein [Pseudomonadota bacterium]